MRPSFEWDISDWVNTLDSDEAAYARQCFKFWNGLTGGQEPIIPDGISEVRAQILRYHVKNLMDTTKNKRKIEQLRVVSIRILKDLYESVCLYSAEIDINISVFIRCCIELSKETVLKHPELLYVLKSVVPK